MKKLKFAGLLLLAPVMLLAGCRSAASTLTFSANWYRNTASKDRVENTLEQLEYAVTFEPASEGSWLSYTDGVYKTELRGDSENRSYIYTTDLTISVTATSNGNPETYQDTVHTEVRFLTAAEGLKPVYSYREVHSHAPGGESSASLMDYAYTYVVSYDDALTKAATVHTDLNTLKTTEREYDIKGNGTFLDNEQILFALRGLDLTAGGSFRSINTVTGVVQGVSIASAAATTQSVNFIADGEEVKNEALAAVAVTIGYTGSNNGQPQTAVFAATTNSSANLYRNVMLCLETPLVYSLGTMRYTLVKANFASSSN